MQINAMDEGTSAAEVARRQSLIVFLVELTGEQFSLGGSPPPPTTYLVVYYIYLHSWGYSRVGWVGEGGIPVHNMWEDFGRRTDGQIS